MALKDRIKTWVGATFIERAARPLSMGDLVACLEEGGRQMAQHAGAASGNTAQCDKLRHIVGIERWGQARLRTALGESLVVDEYDDYRPPADLDWPALQAEFQATRLQTLDLARRLEAAGAGDQRVFHNDWGELSVRGWLYYLNLHASLEGKSHKAELALKPAQPDQPVIQIPLNPFLNVFLLRGDKGAVLVDTGIEGQADFILARLAEYGVSPGDIRLILITHSHVDHFGSAAELRRRCGAPVAIHALDADALRTGSYPPGSMRPTSKLMELIMDFGAQFADQAAGLEPDIVFEAEWRLDDYGVAARVVPTPGHTPGSVSVVLDSGQVIVGDMVMGGLMGLLPRPGRPLLAWDLAQNQASVQRIATLSPSRVYASHGGPFEHVMATEVDWRAVGVGLGVTAAALLALGLFWRRSRD